jgi:hypothetical protein
MAVEPLQSARRGLCVVISFPLFGFCGKELHVKKENKWFSNLLE